MTEEQKKDEQHQEELETVSKEEYDAIVTERDELLQFKPEEKSDEQRAIETKQRELWQKEVSLTLKDKGLEKFASVIKVDTEQELNATIETLNSVIDEYKVENAYIPTDHKKQDEYDNAKNNGDTTGMLKSLFGFK